MSIHTADALVLRHYPYRETSALVTCLTERFGKIKGIVKGLRAPMSRNHRSAMELFTLNRIVFYDSRTSPLHLISQSELISEFRELSRDVPTMQLAAACAELADAVLEPGEPHPEVFTLLRRTLDTLATDARIDPLALRVYYILRLLRLAGFHPQLDECTGCAKPPTDARGFWSVRQGGLLCQTCLYHDPEAEPMPAAWFELLAACSASDEPPALEPSHATLAHQRLEDFLRWRIDHPLKTLVKGDGSRVNRKFVAPNPSPFTLHPAPA